MARWVGIDIRASHVRAVLLRTSYRKVAIEQMLEVSLAEVADLDAALRAVALPLMQQGEPFAIAVEGEQAFIHRLTLPSTALKQLAEVLPFEIEANVPVALDDLVHDHRLLRRDPKAEHVVVMTAAARKAQVRARIDHIKVILGAEPERVGVGTLPLANLASLCPQLAVAGP
ncbi:MAG TPA: pilus assembly protein PilM, partial [Polyangiaceae bacterium]|nr:pilus assembly protein PilM [Polyangiaceae bacterium]